MTRLAQGAMLARAKLNLCLHVVGQRPDGYHLLDSLVAFAEVGDVIEASPSTVLSLALDGPFASELDGGGGNLVLGAAAALAAWAARGGQKVAGAALLLDKRLPVASGLGGGSADAAAALRLLCELWALAPSDAELAEIGLGLGADVPACLSAEPVWMRGIGEKLSPAPLLPGFWVTLVNPGAPVATPRVFAALAEKRNPPPPPPPEAFEDADALLGWLRETRNDLQPPAIAVAPVISQALAALSDAPGCGLARMSGSGATCFGMFRTEAEALRAADQIRAAHPDWWVAAAPVRGGVVQQEGK